MRKFAFPLVAGILLIWGGCASVNNSSTVTGVSATCSATGTTIQSGQTLSCLATVFGTGSFVNTVTWAASAGTINSVGTFTAPTVNTPTSVTVIATSTENPKITGTTSVTVYPVNLEALVVDAGPEPQVFTSVNQAFASVTVCVPGTQTCQSIDHVLVDTGSSGLRLLSSVLTVPLPGQTDSSGNPLAECHIFPDGYGWGPVSLADVSMAGESGPSTPVHVLIPSTSTPAVPSSCSTQTTGPNEGDSVSALGANGVLGVGVFQQDCGAACTSSNGSIPPVYYDCPSSGCNPTYTTLAQQVPNPVSKFLADNNGVLMALPAVPPNGAFTVSGSLIFGIGTQGNNPLQSATVYSVPDSGTNAGQITTTFNGNSYPAIIDSAANAIYFLDSTTTGIPTCTVGTLTWYCPPSPVSVSVTNQGSNGNQGTTSFIVGNASALLGSGKSALGTLAAPLTGSFDWGLPFFYNRDVFTAIENTNTPAGPGPYVAY